MIELIILAILIIYNLIKIRKCQQTNSNNKFTMTFRILYLKFLLISAIIRAISLVYFLQANYKQSEILDYLFYCIPCTIWASSYYFMILFFVYIYYDINEKSKLCFYSPDTVKALCISYLIFNFIFWLYAPSDDPETYLEDSMLLNCLAYIVAAIGIYLTGQGLMNKINKMILEGMTQLNPMKSQLHVLCNCIGILFGLRAIYFAVLCSDLIDWESWMVSIDICVHEIVPYMLGLCIKLQKDQATQKSSQQNQEMKEVDYDKAQDLSADEANNISQPILH